MKIQTKTFTLPTLISMIETGSLTFANTTKMTGTFGAQIRQQIGYDIELPLLYAIEDSQGLHMLHKNVIKYVTKYVTGIQLPIAKRKMLLNIRIRICILDSEDATDIECFTEATAPQMNQ